MGKKGNLENFGWVIIERFTVLGLYYWLVVDGGGLGILFAVICTALTLILIPANIFSSDSLDDKRRKIVGCLIMLIGTTHPLTVALINRYENVALQEILGIWVFIPIIILLVVYSRWFGQE